MTLLRPLLRRLLRAAPVAHSRSLAAAAAEAPVIEAVRRSPDETGSRKSREMRAEGFVPGIIYGKDDNGNHVEVMVKTPLRRIQQEHHKRKHALEATVYKIKLDDNTEFLASPKQLALHPVSDEPLNLNYLVFSKRRVFSVPVRLVNEELSVALRRGAFMLRISRLIKCVVTDGNIQPPTFLDVDMTGVNVGDTVRLDRVKFPVGVEPAPGVKEDHLVGVIHGNKRGMDEEKKVVDAKDKKKKK